MLSGVVATCLGIALAIAARLALPAGARRTRAVVAAALGGAALGGLAAREIEARAPRPAANRPIEAPGGGYVTSRACQACHSHHYDTWRDSYHSTMTQTAPPERGRGDFDGVELSVYGERYRLERRGDELWVDQPRVLPNGRFGSERVRKPVVMATGSHHVQVYWLPADTGFRKLEMFQFVWRIAERRWVPIDAIFLYPPDARQLAVPLGRWNVQCNRCHAVWPRPRMLNDHAMDTHVAELGVACEACHGPGADHVQRMQNPIERYAAHLGLVGDVGMVDPAELEPLREAQVCGQCHSVFGVPPELEREWRQTGLRYRPGHELHASHAVMSGGGSSWPDGVIRTGGREYGGLVESPCFVHGGAAERTWTCLSCHTMHPASDDPRPRPEWANDQLRPEASGNGPCLGCHPAFAGEEAIAAHTRHTPGSAGSACYDCHMPNTSYGLLKLTRNHQLDSPSVAAAVATGRPNACNLCHLDRPLGWAEEQLHRYWGQPQVALTDEERTVADAVLGLLRGDANQRALWAWHMGWPPALAASGTGWQVPFLAQILVDPYAAPRAIAGRSLAAHPGHEVLGYDYVADLPAREAIRRRVMEAWHKRPAAAGGPGSAVLLDDGGVLDETAFAALLSQRDDRRIVLEE